MIKNEVQSEISFPMVCTGRLGDGDGTSRAQHPPTPLSCRYEDEINKRTAAENEFVVLKKVSQDQLRVAKPWVWGPWEKWGVLAPWHSLMPQKRGNPRNLEGLSEVFSTCSPNPDSAKGWKWWGFLQI